MILEPRYDSRKSFYGKAVVEVQENGYVLCYGIMCKVRSGKTLEKI